MDDTGASDNIKSKENEKTRKLYLPSHGNALG